ncbi:type III secretion protein [Paraburkholderia sp. UYCP14C]|uniref:type III secretion protein n=1 Tax=Paraburkholderia sp. UYCP14C TaxID=2511130 RepID=UPI001022658A|nr:type III secretion protein [Paraburkholderia sp. UYCP14C]RZF23469.1 type III secretion protein [Paraburkholderia sp. UYCP14C]
MSAQQNPEKVRRRVAALQVACGRRERLERRLQAGVMAARDAHAETLAQRDAQLAPTETKREHLRGIHARLTHMMTGGDAFQLAHLNAAMRYADVVAVHVQQMEGELAALDTLLRSKADELAAAMRAVTLNHRRIDLCSERIAGLRVALDRHAADAGDDEAEEAVLARLRSSSP